MDSSFLVQRTLPVLFALFVLCLVIFAEFHVEDKLIPWEIICARLTLIF